MGESRFSKVNLGVDQARQNMEALQVEGSLGGGRDLGGDLHDLSLPNTDLKGLFGELT